MKKNNSVLHKIICCVLTIALCMAIIIVPAQKAKAGVYGVIAGKIAGKAIDIVDGWVVKGLDYAAEETELNAFTKIADLVSTSSTRQVEQMCKEILETLGSIEQKLDQLSAGLEKQIGRLESYIKTYNLSDNASKLSAYQKKYTDAYDSYQSYLGAAQAYSSYIDKGGTDEKQKKNYLDKISFYEKELADAFDTSKSGSINFKNDINEMARLACKFYPRYKDNPNDKTTATLPPTHATTTLDCADTVANSTLAFEHQKYQFLYDQANDCMGAFLTVMMVGSIWTDYNASKSADGEAPFDVSFEFERTSNLVVQAINDIATQCADLTKGIMRQYDTEVDLEINYKDKSTHKWNVSSSSYTGTIYASAATSPEMPVYQVKAIGQSNPVAILQRNPSALFTHGTLASEESIFSRGTTHVNTASQDYLNVMSDKANNYFLINDASQITYMMNRDSYPISGNNMYNYLVKVGGLDSSKLPRSMDTAATSNWRDALYQIGIGVNYGYFHYNYVDKLTSFPLNQSKKDYDKRTKEQVADEKNTPVNGSWRTKIKPLEILVMLYSPGSRHILTLEGNGLSVSDENKYKLSGNVYEVTLKPGSNFDSLMILDANGKVLDTLLTKDSLKYAETNSDGSVTLSLTMPYQDCTIQALYTSEASKPTSQGGSSSSGTGYGVQSYGYEDYDFVPTNIYTFEDLKKAAEAVNTNPETYADASFTLMNNIDGGGAEWTMPIGTEQNPFEGTFDGGGYNISGLDIKEDAGGLFGHIGENGIVSDLCIYDTDVYGGEGYTGVFAAVNKGRLEYCRSGVGHLLMDSADISGIEDLNVFVSSAGTAGGLAGKNEGELVNCSTTASVESDIAGGLAGENTGNIHNSFGTLIAKITGKTYSGGIAGVNNGVLKNLFFGGSIEGSFGGAIVGKYESGDAEACYYAESLREAVGEGKFAALAVRFDDMKKDKFVAKLNEFVTKLNEKFPDRAYYWQRKDGVNLGLPYFHKNPYYERTLADENTKISILGNIHAAAALSITEIPENESVYQEMLSKADNTLSGAYDISLNAPREPAFEGPLNITFPGDGRDAATIGILHGSGGGYTLHNAKKDGNGNYCITVNSLSAFGVVKSAIPRVQAENALAALVTEPDGWDDALMTVLIVVIAVAITAGALVTVFALRSRKRKKYYDGQI